MKASAKTSLSILLWPRNLTTWDIPCSCEAETLIEVGNSTADKILRSDVIIAFVGETSYAESPGNIDDLNLTPNQVQMVQYLATFGKPIVLILNEGRPRLITGVEPLASAVVHTFLPGNYGGIALANLLALTVNPSDLAFVNEDLEWVLEPGDFRASIADQSLVFTLK